MVHFASIRHPAAILDDLHGKVLNEAYQISKSTVTESVSTTTTRQTRKKTKHISKFTEKYGLFCNYQCYYN